MFLLHRERLESIFIFILTTFRLWSEDILKYLWPWLATQRWGGYPRSQSQLGCITMRDLPREMNPTSTEVSMYQEVSWQISTQNRFDCSLNTLDFHFCTKPIKIWEISQYCKQTFWCRRFKLFIGFKLDVLLNYQPYCLLLSELYHSKSN